MITGLYGTLLKVASSIPGNRLGSIAGTSHRNVDMASAREERVKISGRRSSTSLFSAIEKRRLILRIPPVKQQAEEPLVPSNSISNIVSGDGKYNIEATGASMSNGESHDNTRALARRGRGKDRRGVGENELIENFNQVTDGGVFEAFRL